MVVLGQPSREPGTKFDGSFMSIHRPSKETLEWNRATNLSQ